MSMDKKLKLLSQDETKLYMEDLKAGFTRGFASASNVKHDFIIGLASGSMTATAAPVTNKGFLSVMMGCQQVPPTPNSSTTASSTASPIKAEVFQLSQSQDVSAPSPQDTGKRKVFDIGTDRPKAIAALLRDFKQQEDEMQKLGDEATALIMKSDPVKDKVFLTTVFQRYSLCCLWFGQNVNLLSLETADDLQNLKAEGIQFENVIEEHKKKLTLPDDADEMAQWTVRDGEELGDFHARVNKLLVDDCLHSLGASLPVERPDDFKCKRVLDGKVDSMRKLNSEKDIIEIQSDFDLMFKAALKQYQSGA